MMCDSIGRRRSSRRCKEHNCETRSDTENTFPKGLEYGRTAGECQWNTYGVRAESSGFQPVFRRYSTGILLVFCGILCLLAGILSLGSDFGATFPYTGGFSVSAQVVPFIKLKREKHSPLCPPPARVAFGDWLTPGASF